MNAFARRCAIAIALAATSTLAQAASLSINPALPTYGTPVGVQLQNNGLPVYLPATRFKRYGSDTIFIDFEYASSGFGPRPDFGQQMVPLGELPPGNYVVQARVVDISRPNANPELISGTIAVVPPEQWGVYTVPKEPDAFAPLSAVIRSAAYFDPATMRASVSGNVIRVDFDYQSTAPVGGATPAGMTSYASVPLPSLQPGTYRLEGWGRPMSGGDPQRYFTRDFTVASAVPIVEYYSAKLDHYFMAAAGDEIGQLDSGAKGDWARTGQKLKGWLRASDAPPAAKPVCRFYTTGANSHFFTGDASECSFLRNLEQQQRAEANAKNASFTGWQYEGVAFYALVPQAGACAPNTTTVYRAYNKRASQSDSNHRFTADPGLRAAMSVDWADEGAAFCSPN